MQNGLLIKTRWASWKNPAILIIIPGIFSLKKPDNLDLITSMQGVGDQTDANFTMIGQMCDVACYYQFKKKRIIIK